MTKEYHQNQAYFNGSNGASANGHFNIRDYVEFDAAGRAFCPACSPRHPNKKSKTLSVTPSGAYKCFRECSPEEIRAAIGQPKDKIIPSALAAPSLPPQKIANLVVGSESIEKSCIELIEAKSNAAFQALKWLKARGITLEMVRHYRLGLVRTKVKSKNYHAISIPIPAGNGRYFQKKRIAPWEKDLPDYVHPWAQKGITAQTWFTHNPPSARETWLCEGEWDAICLGWMVKASDLKNDVAVACFTCGCSNVPPQSELEKLTGLVKIFYDRNDKPNPKGMPIGEAGAKKVAEQLGDRASIALVPMPDGCTVKGWDVSDAINSGYSIKDFQEASVMAMSVEALVEEKIETKNSIDNFEEDFFDDMKTAPEYVDWLVPDLLSNNELFLLAAPPRAGKSLLVMNLAQAVAEGSNFLGRPAKKGLVLYFCLEDSSIKLKQRFMKQGWSESAKGYIKKIRKFSFSQMEDLEAKIITDKPSLIIFDTFSRCRDDNLGENSAEIAKILAPLQDMAEKYEVCILLVHHTRKNTFDETEGSGAFDAIRGSGAIRATCRGALIMTKDKNQNCFLIAENGHASVPPIPIYLDEPTMTWKLKSDWKINVNLNQKDRVIEYLKLVQSATVPQIADGTDIPQSSIYKTLMRLVADGEIGREGSQRTTTYYLIQSGKSGVPDFSLADPDSYIERDREDFLTKNFVSKEGCSHYSKSRSDSDFLSTTQKIENKNPKTDNLPEFYSTDAKSTVPESGKSLASQTCQGSYSHFTQNLAENNSSISENNSHTTNNFLPSENGHYSTDAKSGVSENDENRLEWIKTKDGEIFLVDSDFGDELLVHESGMRKKKIIKLAECAELHYREEEKGNADNDPSN
jgi:hypothetical protein